MNSVYSDPARLIRDIQELQGDLDEVKSDLHSLMVVVEQAQKAGYRGHAANGVLESAIKQMKEKYGLKTNF